MKFYISPLVLIFALLIPSDGDICDIVVSKNRGTMIKFHVEEENSKCKGKVRFKINSSNQTYCLLSLCKGQCVCVCMCQPLSSVQQY